MSRFEWEIEYSPSVDVDCENWLRCSFFAAKVQMGYDFVNECPSRSRNSAC